MRDVVVLGICYLMIIRLEDTQCSAVIGCILRRYKYNFRVNVRFVSDVAAVQRRLPIIEKS